MMHMTPPTILSAARFAVAALLLISGLASAADELPPSKIRVTWQIRGLFSPEGEKDFRALFAENLPEVRVVDVDVPNAEATLEFDPAVAFDPRFRNVKPELLLGLFNAKLSPRKPPSIFSLHARRTTPLEKLCWIEIPFEGLDCQACAFGVYQLILAAEGVEQATVNLQTGLVTALVAPAAFDERAMRRKFAARGIGLTLFEHYGGGIRREGTMDGAWRRWPAVSYGQAAATPAPPADADRQQWTPPEFASIPGGRYQRGDNGPEMFDGPFRGVQTVTLGGYSMAVTATTKSQWDAVRTWAAAHGYADLADGAGRAADHPIHTVSWHDVVKWCNAASERDGLKPCYALNGTVYRTGASDAVACDWKADGYRLPTEAEWEVAARGGLQGKRFPWGDMISHDQANYIAAPKLPYDASGKTDGHHPRFALVGAAGTSPVKTFPPNGYGLFDMTGNVSQWCWDWFGRYGKEPATDPKGPAEMDWGPVFPKEPAKKAGVEGALRILRGGHWNRTAERAACAFRLTAFPKLASTTVGFRLARGGSAGKPSGLLSQPGEATDGELRSSVEQAWRASWDRFHHDGTHLFYDFVCSYNPEKRWTGLPTPEETRRAYPNPNGWGTGMEDCAISGGLMMAMICDRFAATQDASLRPFAQKVFAGLVSLGTLGATDGFVIRGLCPADGRSHYPESSRDQYTWYVYGLWRYFHSPLSQPEEKNTMRRIIAAICARMERNVVAANDYRIGKDTGEFDSIVDKMWENKAHEVARLPMFYAIGADMTGDPHWQDLADRYAPEAAAKSKQESTETPYALLQQQVSMHALYVLEKTPALKQQWLEAMRLVADRAERYLMRCLQYRVPSATDVSLDWRTWPLRRGSGGYQVPTHPDSIKAEIHAIREPAEAALTLLLCPQRSLTPEQTVLLRHIIAQVDSTKVVFYGHYYTQAAFWKAVTLGHVKLLQP
jgi:formylglycine-generating enzyme required for sulfatase activity